MTFLLALSSLLSRLLGVYRNHALAVLFGASSISDAYFAAFQIPDTVYRLLVFGAISASFVPLFLSLKKEDSKRSWEFVSSVLNGFLIFILLLSGVIFLFADQFVSLLYSDFTPEMQIETVSLLKVMLLSPILFTFSSVFSGIQNAFRTFWGFALAPIVYNIGIIVGILYLSPTMGIIGVAYGVVAGAFLHALVQLFPVLRLGFVWRPVFVWSAAFKKLLFTAIPRLLSMASFQLNFFIEGVVATTLFAGNLTILRYAQDIQSFPIGIIGISMAISSFSVISHFIIDENIPHLAAYLKDKLDHLLLLLIPAACGLFVLRYPIIQLILEGGVFDEQSVELTATTLSFLCVGLVAAAIVPIVTRVFFAFHDTIRPFAVTVITVSLNTFLAIYLSQVIGVAGIGLASSISISVSLILLLIILRLKYLKGSSFFPWKNFSIFLGASALMSYFLMRVAELVSYSSHWMVLLAQILGMTVLGVIVYTACCFLFLRKKLFHLVRTLGK